MKSTTRRSACAAGVALAAAVLSAAAQEKPRGQQPAPASPTAQHMRVHFSKALEAHDAVVRGDLAGVKAPAEWLATHAATEELDKASASQVATMRHAALQAANARDIADAAQGAAAMLSACGTCHRAARANPPIEHPPASHGEGTVGHMLEHKRAVDLMMEGLIIPSDARYREGAEALKAAPLKSTELPRDAKLTREIAAAEDAVHLLADRAAAARDDSARVEAYSQIITSCARCHGLHQQAWGPRE